MSRQLTVFTLLTLLLFAGCASPGRHTGTGMLLGSAIGAGAGAIIGHQQGETGPGAAIGAGLGALAGGLIGNSVDAAEAEAEERAEETEARVERALHEVRPESPRLSILDIIRMSQAGLGDELIIAKIDQSGSYYRLSASEMIDLRRSSVSDRVIAFMLRSPATVVARTPQPEPPSQNFPVPVPVSLAFPLSTCR